MQPLITSLSNPRVKEAIKLRERKGRVAQQRIIIDGAREVARAEAAGVVFSEVFVCPALLAEEGRATLARLEQARAPLVPVAPAVFAKLAYGERGEGLIACARPPARAIEDISLPPLPLVAVLVGIEKPGNVGAILRSADAAGVSAVLVVDGGTDLYNPNAIRASLGAIFTLPVCAVSTADALAWLRAWSLALFAARVEGSSLYAQQNFRQPAAVILGSEAAGLPAAWRATDIRPTALPMLGQVDSLNVSVAAAILFYEAWRQRCGG